MTNLVTNVSPRHRTYRGGSQSQAGLFSNTYLSKTEIAKSIGVHRETVKNWDDIAFWKVKEYKVDYPLKSDGISRERKATLSPFQIWVIGRICILMSQMHSQDRVKQFITANPSQFSREMFRAQYKAQRSNAA